jgi:hypothetical protein
MLATLAQSDCRTSDGKWFIRNAPLNYVDPTGLIQAGNPLTNLNVYGGGYTGGNIADPRFVNPYIASTNIGAKIPTVNLAGGLNSYSTTKTVDQYFLNQNLNNYSKPPSDLTSQFKVPQAVLKTNSLAPQSIGGPPIASALDLVHSVGPVQPRIATSNGEAGYLSRTWSQVVYGEYSDAAPTGLGVGISVAAGFTGLDFAADIRDITHNVTHWQWTWGHAGKTALNTASLLPFVGALKHVDEGVEVVQGTVKNAPKNFSNPKFGNEVHDDFGRALLEQTGTRESDWIFRTSPGQNGVDATYQGAKDIGFRHAELKPRSPNGLNQFENQVNNWQQRGQIQPSENTSLWFYNERGIIGQGHVTK